jgi:hypothetical protein
MDDRPDKVFQDYFDALMSGNLARRRMVKFVPADLKLIETRQPPLKDRYDEWLARVICYAFSVPAFAFVSQVNRATSETLRMQATQEGLVPLKAWVKTALDQVVQVHLKQADLEFVWVGDDAVDPLEQAQTLNILVNAGIKTREEARADLGLAPEGKSGGFGKYNHNHDPKSGQFATAEGAGTTAPANHAQGAHLASIIPICIATGIAIATDEYGNQLSVCHYECHGGLEFSRTFRGGGGCPPVRMLRW